MHKERGEGGKGGCECGRRIQVSNHVTLFTKKREEGCANDKDDVAWLVGYTQRMGEV